jgi:glycosyltransferase involved in cell wall biosynthesis
VIINNYNYAQHVGEAIESALAQLAQDDELIIVDDGSTDESAAVITKFTSDSRVVFVEQENAGQLRATLKGIELCQGDVAFLLDSDDYYLPGYLERVRKLYCENPEIDAVFSSAHAFGDHPKHLARVKKLLQHIHYETGLLGPQKWGALLFHEFQGTTTSGMSMRTTVARQLLPAAEYRFGKPDMFLRLGVMLIGKKNDLSHISADGTMVRALAAMNAVRYVDDTPGFAYRLHGANYHASLSWFGQQIQRYSRKRFTSKLLWNLVGNQAQPSAAELSNEVQNRSWPSRQSRQWPIRARYAWKLLFATGSFRQRLEGFMSIWR